MYFVQRGVNWWWGGGRVHFQFLILLLCANSLLSFINMNFDPNPGIWGVYDFRNFEQV
jgi:hypothetical protein